MKNKTVVAAIAAMIMSTGGIAFAQGKSDHDDRKGNRDDRGHQNQSQRNGQQDCPTIRATPSWHSVATSAAPARATVIIVAIGSRPNTAIASMSSMTGAAIV